VIHCWNTQLKRFAKCTLLTQNSAVDFVLDRDSFWVWTKSIDQLFYILFDQKGLLLLFAEELFLFGKLKIIGD